MSATFLDNTVDWTSLDGVTRNLVELTPLHRKNLLAHLERNAALWQPLGDRPADALCWIAGQPLYVAVRELVDADNRTAAAARATRITQHKVVICRGLQGSGKTTHSLAWVAADPAGRTRINRDDIRFGYYNSYWGDTVSEPGVDAIEYAIAEAIMAEGRRDVIVDATNVKALSVLPYLGLAEQFGYNVVFHDFDVPLEELLRRDRTRDKPVGADVIESYWARYTVDGHLTPAPTSVQV